MPRPKLHNREETLKKALSFFWKNGFSGGSTRELGQALGMHPGSIYSSFGSKEKLYLEAIELYGRQSREVFEECLEGVDFYSGFEDFLGRLVSDGEHPCTCFLAKTFSSRLTDDAALVEKARELVTGFRAHIASRITRAKEEGDLSTEVDPDAFATVIQAQIMGLRNLADSAPGEDVLNGAVKDVVAILVKASAA